MPDDTTDPDVQCLDVALTASGCTAAHDVALAALLPEYAEREELVVFVAHELTRRDTAAGPAALACLLAAALLRRFPHAAPQPLLLAGEAVVLQARLFDPASLPPAGATPALLAPPN